MEAGIFGHSHSKQKNRIELSTFQSVSAYNLTNFLAGNNYKANADGLRYEWTSAALGDGETADDSEDVHLSPCGWL